MFKWCRHVWTCECSYEIDHIKTCYKMWSLWQFNVICIFYRDFHSGNRPAQNILTFKRTNVHKTSLLSFKLVKRNIKWIYIPLSFEYTTILSIFTVFLFKIHKIPIFQVTLAILSRELEIYVKQYGERHTHYKEPLLALAAQALFTARESCETDQ